MGPAFHRAQGQTAMTPKISVLAVRKDLLAQGSLAERYFSFPPVFPKTLRKALKPSS